MNITEPSGRLTRWRLRLVEYAFRIKDKKCSETTRASALSRLLTGAPMEPNEQDDIPPFSMKTSSAQ